MCVINWANDLVLLRVHPSDLCIIISPEIIYTFLNLLFNQMLLRWLILVAQCKEKYKSSYVSVPLSSAGKILKIRTLEEKKCVYHSKIWQIWISYSYVSKWCRWNGEQYLPWSDYSLSGSCLTTKQTKWLCAQQRLRSAWASAQSDQSLHCALNG